MVTLQVPRTPHCQHQCQSHLRAWGNAGSRASPRWPSPAPAAQEQSSFYSIFRGLVLSKGCSSFRGDVCDTNYCQGRSQGMPVQDTAIQQHTGPAHGQHSLWGGAPALRCFLGMEGQASLAAKARGRHSHPKPSHKAHLLARNQPQDSHLPSGLPSQWTLFTGMGQHSQGHRTSSPTPSLPTPGTAPPSLGVPRGDQKPRHPGCLPLVGSGVHPQTSRTQEGPLADLRQQWEWLLWGPHTELTLTSWQGLPAMPSYEACPLPFPNHPAPSALTPSFPSRP